MRLSSYTAPMSRWLPLILLSLLAPLASAQTRTQDVIYLKSGGTAFTMDVLKPAKPNKAAVVFMVSGGWISDHSMIKSFGADIEKAFADGGFTVFSVVHGAQPRFKVAEIVEQVRTAVRFVHAHAADYGIDTNRVGVSGISSGGHLSLMIAGSPDSPVNAVAAIAPPTDLANWGKPAFVFTEDPQLAMFIPALGFDPKWPKSDIEYLARKLSPITFVNPNYPPTLIVHGDDDKIVPLQQAQAMDQALARAGVEHKLEVIPGGGHDDKTFRPGVMKALQWFKDKLLKPRKSRKVAYVDLGCLSNCKIVYSANCSLTETVRLLHSRGNISVMRSALARGADPNVTGILFATMVLWHENTTMLLVDSGANINVHWPPEGMTPLMGTACDPHCALLLYFLRHGARPNDSDRNGRTALMVAVEANNIDGIRNLLRFGANPKQKAKNGDSAIDLAKRGGNRLVKRLFGVTHR